MKKLVDYINENQEKQRIDEAYFPFAELAGEASWWAQYLGAIFVLFEIWLTIFIGTGILTDNNDYDSTFGIKTLYNLIKNKFKKLKYKKQLKEMQTLLDNDPEYKEWVSKPEKQRKLKDLKPIVIKYQNDDNVRSIIKDIWEESKYSN